MAPRHSSETDHDIESLQTTIKRSVSILLIPIGFSVILQIEVLYLLERQGTEKSSIFAYPAMLVGLASVIIGIIYILYSIK